MCEVRVHLHHFLHLALQLFGAVLRRRAGPELVGALQHEGSDLEALRVEKPRRVPPSLPVRKGDGAPGRLVGEVVGGVLGLVAGVVGIWRSVPALHGAVLVGAVVPAEFDERVGRRVAHTFRRLRVGRVVVGVEALLPEPLARPLHLVRVYVEEGAVSGVGDGLFLVRLGAFRGGAPELGAEPRADGLVVVGGPGVVHRGDDDGHGAREDRWARLVAVGIAPRRLQKDLHPPVDRRRLEIRSRLTVDEEPRVVGHSHLARVLGNELT